MTLLNTSAVNTSIIKAVVINSVHCSCLYCVTFVVCQTCAWKLSFLVFRLFFFFLIHHSSPSRNLNSILHPETGLKLNRKHFQGLIDINKLLLWWWILLKWHKGGKNDTEDEKVQKKETLSRKKNKPERDGARGGVCCVWFFFWGWYKEPSVFSSKCSHQVNINKYVWRQRGGMRGGGSAQRSRG